ncbi:unnamed protein product [Didymodactylos carnosus]|uniref:Uncharacterized protein n=1 Tax=Didymodactylos carnosus TaxID=1234261 RepID=A0A813V3E3_9BILA|nr:unnamed protein product [Didymodactylos carnosus]CAF0835459.1 unnamed protein product [Didymodactylos carnosus]CAF3571241.1 unnamed protein product [Didymodactylos carnosus]CAF3622679.1 unnamed protein product [Didymodactylos carnosus]
MSRDSPIENRDYPIGNKIITDTSRIQTTNIRPLARTGVIEININLSFGHSRGTAGKTTSDYGFESQRRLNNNSRNALAIDNVDIQLIDEYRGDKTTQRIRVSLQNLEIQDESYVCLIPYCPLIAIQATDYILINVSTFLSHLRLQLTYEETTGSVMCFGIYTTDSMKCLDKINLHPKIKTYTTCQISIYDCQANKFQNIYRQSLIYHFQYEQIDSRIKQSIIQPFEIDTQLHKALSFNFLTYDKITTDRIVSTTLFSIQQQSQTASMERQQRAIQQHPIIATQLLSVNGDIDNSLCENKFINTSEVNYFQFNSTGNDLISNCFITILPLDNPWYRQEHSSSSRLGPCRTKISAYHAPYYTDDVVKNRFIHAKLGSNINITW